MNAAQCLGYHKTKRGSGEEVRVLGFSFDHDDHDDCDDKSNKYHSALHGCHHFNQIEHWVSTFHVCGYRNYGVCYVEKSRKVTVSLLSSI